MSLFSCLRVGLCVPNNRGSAEEIAELFMDSQYNEPKAKLHIEKIEVFNDKYKLSIKRNECEIFIAN